MRSTRARAEGAEGPLTVRRNVGRRDTAAQQPSPPVFEVRLLHDQKVPMRDGVRLSADVFLPRAPGPFPSILSRTPYESNSEYHVEWAVWWARRGYAAVLQDLRGRYESE